MPGPAPDQAFATPTAPFLLHLVTPPLKNSWEEIVQATQEVFAQLAPSLTGELCYNFLRGDQQPLVAAAFTESAFLRLQAVKRRYDPHNVFHLNLNIEPATA